MNAQTLSSFLYILLSITNFFALLQNPFLQEIPGEIQSSTQGLAKFESDTANLFDWKERQAELVRSEFVMEKPADLPRSYYMIYFWTSDGIQRRHRGVAVQSNALISSDHLLPKNIKPEVVIRIQITDIQGNARTSENFIVQQGTGFTYIVFQENLIPEGHFSPLVTLIF